MEKIILTTFTDPMMGLSYEQEPVYEKLAEHYGDRLVFKYVMSGLVRDVSDFMLPEELVLPADEGIRVYNRRLAWIYKDEESIGGLPINMDGSKGPRAQKVADFAARLEEACGMKVQLVDERCSTMVAHTYLDATGTHGKKRKDVVDTLSAQIILQDYLDRHRA